MGCLVMSKALNVIAATAFLLAAQSVAGSAFAAGFCQLSDGTMGMQCVVQSSGQVYGCVKDLKDCAALSPVKPSGANAAAKAPPPPPPPPSPASHIGKSRSNIQNN
jgi:hypothetical protein